MDFAEKSRKFFEKQQLVKYQKIWHLPDHIGKTLTNPDIGYLESFEKKYGINLWSIAYEEREFYKFNKFYKFRAEEVLSLLEEECKFFESVLDEVQPSFLSIFMTNNHYQELLCRLCKAKGIRILMLGPARFGNRLMISEEGAVLDRDLAVKPASANFKTFEELHQYMKEFDTTREMNEWIKLSFDEHPRQRYFALLKFLFSRRTPNYSKNYTNYGKTRLKVIKTKVGTLFAKKTRMSFINKRLTRHIRDEPFIYFPLHMEPERVLLIGAPFYSDQRSVITNIAKSIPIGYKLYIKEHPIMRIVGWRETSFYKEIMELPNVVLLHPSVSHEELIQKSSLVITIAGTTGQEAAFYNKPSIVMTDQQYSHLPSVTLIKSIDELPQVIPLALSKRIDPSSLGEYVQMIKENTFEFNLKRFSADFAFRFGFKGLVMDAELPADKVELFIKDYENAFETLAQEHVKKIKRIKELQAQNHTVP